MSAYLREIQTILIDMRKDSRSLDTLKDDVSRESFWKVLAHINGDVGTVRDEEVDESKVAVLSKN